MAGFQVIMYGRFWVITEDKEKQALWFGEMGVESCCEIRTEKHDAKPRAP